MKSVGRTATRQAAQAVLTVAFLPHDTVISLDAVMRTLGRLIFTRRHLLEWQTAKDVERQNNGRLQSFFAAMWSAPAAGLGHCGAAFFPRQPSFMGHSWISGGCGWFRRRLRGGSASRWQKNAFRLSTEQIRQLHRLARKTWNFFETFVSAEDHWLPPDNFQEYPHPVVATRTSPTNIGLALLGALSAYDFGYLSLPNLMQHLARTLDTMEKLERYNGHFYNWYDTRTLKPLTPLYVSTVDNGNLAGLLLTLHSGLLELTEQNWSAARIIRRAARHAGSFKGAIAHSGNGGKFGRPGKTIG